MQLIRTDDLVKAAKLQNFGGENTAKILMSLLQLDKINQIYTRHYYKEGPEFIHDILSDAGIRYKIPSQELQRIPIEGPFILIANHPFGGIEGMILLNSIIALRPDFKIMANFLLQWIPAVKNHIFSVNPFEQRQQNFSSFQGMKQALLHVENGHPLAIFPAGEVSTYQNGSGLIEDKPWAGSVIKLIKKADVPVIPVYFQGNNSWLFHAMGKIHPLLRTVKLPSELLNKANETISIRIGLPISVAEQKSFTDISKYGRYLRARTYALGAPFEGTAVRIKSGPKCEKVMDAIHAESLAGEIIRITPGYQLFRCKQYVVYAAPSSEIPFITGEIGRLREITFREIGEGTNQSLDIDTFDGYYHQLFIWDSEAQKIVGGYRVGKGKEIFAKYGAKGFYLNTLFRLGREMNDILNQSLELGRSFVTKEYQRKPLSLFMLWKGILALLLNNKDYKYLMGPVSISNSFSALSQQLIVEYVKKYHFDKSLSEYIHPRTPFVYARSRVNTESLLSRTTSFGDLDVLLGEIEMKDRRTPVLLKKYLELGGRIIGFNRDPRFNNCLDGLLLLRFEDVSEDVLQSFGKNMDL